MEKESILQAIKSHGFKITQTRQHFIELFLSTVAPLTHKEINDYLNSVYKNLDKTTIYREIDFLLNQGIIKEIDFGEGKKRYELADREHHHHAICTNCNKVQDVHLDETIEAQATKVLGKNNFKITGHMLEFFGLCVKCREIKCE